MTTTYDHYKETNEWKIIQKAIEDLIKNQDLVLTTVNDYVIGYITRHIIEGKKNGA